MPHRYGGGAFMKVAIDATPLTVPTGGIARYTRQLHNALCAEFPDDEFTLLSPAPGRWWSSQLPRLLRREKYSLFHGTDFAVPYLPVTPAVMMLHDLSPWRAEYAAETSARVRRRTPWLLRLGLAARVITPTEAVRREAIAEFGLVSEVVRAIPHGVEPRFFVEAPASTYLLAVGTEGVRKNYELAIATARAVGRELHIAGRGGGGATATADAPGVVRWLGAAPDEALPQLYARAAAFLFPSHYEGFGLPLLEAMAAGVPVIASADPALREVAGGAALHASTPAEWAAAVAAALGARRAELVAAGRRRAAEFTWARTARLTRALYAEVLGC
ncbi:MAG: glycosyltransferase family 4 protein [Bryobacterales bacterium]|nr:glycosyltransferase family 4 protein [Bryobacterales bacterium]